MTMRRSELRANCWQLRRARLTWVDD